MAHWSDPIYFPPQGPMLLTDYLVGLHNGANAKWTAAEMIAGLGAVGTFLQSGAGAVLRTSQDKERERVTPQDFGAKGDTTTGLDGTDDTIAVQSAFNSGAKMVDIIAPHMITAGVVIPVGVAVRFRGGCLWYNGTQNTAALTIGSISANNLYVDMLSLDVRSAVQSTWNNTSYIGIRIINAIRCRIGISRAAGFCVGVQCEGNGSAKGFAYNNIDVLDLVDNQYALHLYNANAGGFCNQNNFFGGRYGCTSSTNTAMNAYGVWMSYDGVADRLQNQNVFYNPAFEMQDGTGGAVRVPFLLDGCGTRNRTVQARHESGSGPFAILQNYGAITGNVFEVGYLGGANTTATIVETSGPKNNVYRDQFAWRQAVSEWRSGDLSRLMTSYGAATTPYIMGDLHFTTSGSFNFAKFLNNATLISLQNEIGITGSGAGVGVFLDTADNKRFIVRVKSRGTFDGNLWITCFDAAGNILSSGGPNTPYVRSGQSTSDLSTSASYGGSYVTPTTTVSDNYLTFNSFVDHARIAFTGGGGVLYMSGISITAYGESIVKPIRVYSGLRDNPYQALASAIPSTAGVHGSYAVGNTIFNAVAAAGVPSHWTCSTAGWLTAIWAINTVYAVGMLAINDTGKVYVCTVAGTSAGSGGPTGTGTGIVDNTVTWDYLGVKAVFVTSGNLV